MVFGIIVCSLEKDTTHRWGRCDKIATRGNNDSDPRLQFFQLFSLEVLPVRLRGATRNLIFRLRHFQGLAKWNTTVPWR